MPIPATVLLTAVLALLLVLLAANVSRLRMQLKVSLGDGGHHELSRAMRAHGNNAEHAPIFILTALAYELTAGTTTLLLTLCGLFLAARLVFTWGLLSRASSQRRMLGAGVTYAAEAALAIALAMRALDA